jgi:gamma-glutamyltranspeptidase/glutathione hydrolase
MIEKRPGKGLAALGLLVGLATVATANGCTSGRLPVRGKHAPLYAPEIRSEFGMVSTGSLEASRAGAVILEQGGNAVDAAVAAAFALGVADPGGSGLGGMTYILVSLADGRASAIDGSVTVPFAADASRLLEIREAKEYFGYAAVAVPTTLAALDLALKKYGTMDLATVLQPAIEIAGTGYGASANSIAWASGYLDEIVASENLRFSVLPDGTRLATPNEVMCRPDLKTTLERIAAGGADSFYRGAIARLITSDMAANGGFVSAADLATVKTPELAPLRGSYRGAEVLSFPTPGAGAEVLMALNILGTYPSSFFAGTSAQQLQVLVEAYRIAHADASKLSSDPMHLARYGAEYLSQEHARQRAALITPGRAIPEDRLESTTVTSVLGEHTTHVSVADRHGNVVSLTQTLCRQYGSKVATSGLGFPYNSCLEFLDLENPASPTYLRPQTRFPTGMAPTILRDDDWSLALGSAGSDRIAPSVTDVIVNFVDRRMTLRDAVVAPRVMWNSTHDPERVCLEIADPITPRDADRLQGFGFEHMYRLRYPAKARSETAFFGGVNAVAYDSTTGVFTGVGDPRRDGFAAGPRVAAFPD